MNELIIEPCVHEVHWSQTASEDYHVTITMKHAPWAGLHHIFGLDTPDHIANIIAEEQKKFPAHIVKYGDISMKMEPKVDAFIGSQSHDQWNYVIIVNNYCNGEFMHHLSTYPYVPSEDWHQIHMNHIDDIKNNFEIDITKKPEHLTLHKFGTGALKKLDHGKIKREG